MFENTKVTIVLSVTAMILSFLTFLAIIDAKIYLNLLNFILDNYFLILLRFAN